MDANVLIEAMQEAAAQGWHIEIRPDSIPDSMIVVARRQKDAENSVVTNAFLVSAKQADLDGMKPLHYTLDLLMKNINSANVQYFS